MNPARAERPRCVGESGGDELGMLVLERTQLVEEDVVGAVVDLGIVEDVVAVVVVLDQAAQLRRAIDRRGRPR